WRFLVFAHIGYVDVFFFSSRRRHTSFSRDWSSDVCSSDLTLFNGLLHTRGFDELDFSSLKLSLGGGMAVQRAVAEHWKRVTGTRSEERRVGIGSRCWGLYTR